MTLQGSEELPIAELTAPVTVNSPCTDDPPRAGVSNRAEVELALVGPVLEKM